MAKIGAVVVAAGRTSRMGAFKPLLPFEDSTISLHIIQLLKQIGADPIVVVTGYRAAWLEEHLAHTGVRFVRNEMYFETQMFDSFYIGVQALKDECDKILLMPVDTPAIRMNTFRQMLMIDADLVRTSYGGEPGHPIMVKREVLDRLVSYTGNQGLRGAVETSGIAVTNLVVDDKGVNWDVDSQEEYQKLIDFNYRRDDGYPIQPLIQVQLMANDVFFGPGTGTLLEFVDRTGSIQEACSQMNMSYSKGCRLVKNAEKQLGFKILERWTGGAGGGGSHLTKEGKNLLRCYNELVERIQNSAIDIFRECFAKGLQC